MKAECSNEGVPPELKRPGEIFTVSSPTRQIPKTWSSQQQQVVWISKNKPPVVTKNWSRNSYYPRAWNKICIKAKRCFLSVLWISVERTTRLVLNYLPEITRLQKLPSLAKRYLKKFWKTKNETVAWRHKALVTCYLADVTNNVIRGSMREREDTLHSTELWLHCNLRLRETPHFITM